eukprot:3664142-Pleurochrysis_carterae.AAC.2
MEAVALSLPSSIMSTAPSITALLRIVAVFVLLINCYPWRPCRASHRPPRARPCPDACCTRGSSLGHCNNDSERGARSTWSSNAIDPISPYIRWFRCVRAGWPSRGAARASSSMLRARELHRGCRRSRCIYFTTTSGAKPKVCARYSAPFWRPVSHINTLIQARLPEALTHADHGQGAHFFGMDASFTDDSYSNSTGKAKLSGYSDSGARKLYADNLLPATPDWRLWQWAEISYVPHVHEAAEPVIRTPKQLSINYMFELRKSQHALVCAWLHGLGVRLPLRNNSQRSAYLKTS